MSGIKQRVNDGTFLWENNRKGSAFLLLIIVISSISKSKIFKSFDEKSFKLVSNSFIKII
jgi:hypothetical protein